MRALVTGATGYHYRDRGDETLPETAGPGQGLLDGVCADWEREW